MKEKDKTQRERPVSLQCCIPFHSRDVINIYFKEPLIVHLQEIYCMQWSIIYYIHCGDSETLYLIYDEMML